MVDYGGEAKQCATDGGRGPQYPLWRRDGIKWRHQASVLRPAVVLMSRSALCELGFAVSTRGYEYGVRCCEQTLMGG